MPIYTQEQLLSQLENRSYAPVYFLQGDGNYDIDMLVQYFTHQILPTDACSFNLTIIYGKEQRLDAVLAQSRRFPMGSSHQVVIVKEAQEMVDLKLESGRAALEQYLKSPQPATLLVFAHPSKTLDGRSTLSRSLVKNGVLVNTKRMHDHQIPNWITKQDPRITPKAASMLQSMVGSDLQRLSKEISKLQLNAKKNELIDDYLVQRYVGISRIYNVFELQRAFSKKDIDLIHRIIHHIIKNPKKHPVIPIIGMLYAFWSKVLLVHVAKDHSDQSLSRLLQVSPNFIGEYIESARNYNEKKTFKIISALIEADLQIKGISSGNLAEEEILLELFGRILA